ncbi:hypothetical protein SAMD00023353_3500620 [Rosellinia necatrix]|uniref:Uncharacterized protein n=1 Tax=Rosellinia necatrix TaxID=77044 RepID=A0A1W2TMS6_ROSNE|nr:hypothetical protein SAMD00023353_3500620 [Rosellinia necatrix]
MVGEKELPPLLRSNAVFAAHTEFNLKAKSKHAKAELCPIPHFELDLTYDWVTC